MIGMKMSLQDFKKTWCLGVECKEPWEISDKKLIEYIVEMLNINLITTGQLEALLIKKDFNRVMNAYRNAQKR
jgi:alpha-L-arabinofuranosidase